MGDERPQELVTVPLVRARFCELIAPLTCLAESSNDLFLLGLLSAIDVILDMKMTDVLKEITIREEIPDALLGKKNTYHSVFDVALMYERSDWDKIGAAAAQLGINENALPGLFLHAVDWAGGIITGHSVEEIEATSDRDPKVEAASSFPFARNERVHLPRLNFAEVECCPLIWGPTFVNRA